MSLKRALSSCLKYLNMKCPNCQNNFDFTWLFYWKGSWSFNRFKVPCCKLKVKLKLSWLYKILVGSFSFFAGFIGMLALLNDLNISIKMSAILLMILILILYIDKSFNTECELLNNETKS